MPRPGARGTVDDIIRPGAGDIIDDAGRPGGGVAADVVKGACSFSAGTLVLMADGTTKAISQVRVGEQVLATDGRDRRHRSPRGAGRAAHTDQLLLLETSAGAITTTEDHRYWNATDQQWQQAQHLHRGDHLHTADGAIVTVDGLDWSTRHTATAYDLTVAEHHTFYVTTGTEAVLVHNCDPALACLQADDVTRNNIANGHAATAHASKFPGQSLRQVIDETIENATR